MEIQKEIKLDLLDVKAPALSATSDMPVVETKPDATNEGKPPALETESKPAPEAEAKAETAAPEEGKTTAESATVEEPDEDAAASAEPAKKPAKGVQKRIDELTRQAREAERLAEAERQEKLRLLALLEKGPKEEEKPVTEETTLQRPSRQQFESQEAYEAALESYIEAKAADTAKRAVEERITAERQKAEREAIERGQKEAQAAYQARVEKVVAKYPDYREVAESPDVQVSIPMAHAIVASDHGPEIQYYLGKNPAEAKRISNLNPALQLVELGLIVARLTQEPKPEPKKPVVSAAPKPIKPLDAGSDTQVAKDPNEMSMEEYAAWAKERDRKAARPGVR